MPFPTPTLATHDQRYPDASPVVGGPYLAGYTPLSTRSDGQNNIMGVPSALTVPGAKALFDAVSAATIQGEGSSGDKVGVTIYYGTEDHASIPLP